ncbi:nicotianamine synthase [Phlyctema vagabunda]|uniref:Nicotianamine synthase n=1 Tax=Phlyctema vagabunda TaxID=108571 RepID=A0ABR4P7J8_9HELO
MASIRQFLQSFSMFNGITARVTTEREQHIPKMRSSSPQVEVYVADILDIYGELSARSDLSPCQTVNTLFGRLVNICIQTLPHATTQQILEDPRILEILSPLRVICATAECHLESYWADKINSAEDVYTALTDFPYYGNYVDLTRMELAALYSVEPTTPRRIAFIGSGPLPLTSMCLCLQLENNERSYKPSSTLISPPPSPSPSDDERGTIVVNIDRNQEAITQSSALCSNLGQKFRGMRFSCEEAGTAETDLKEFDVVYLAALVGMTNEDKQGILADIVGRMNVGSLLVIRTAHSLRKLLYPEFDLSTEAVLACLDIEVVVHPYNHVVNSVIVGRVKARSDEGLM